MMNEEKRIAMKEAFQHLNASIHHWEKLRETLKKAGETTYVAGCTNALEKMLDVSEQMEEEFESDVFPDNK